MKKPKIVVQRACVFWQMVRTLKGKIDMENTFAVYPIVSKTDLSPSLTLWGRGTSVNGFLPAIMTVMQADRKLKKIRAKVIS